MQYENQKYRHICYKLGTSVTKGNSNKGDTKKENKNRERKKEG